MSRDRIIVVTLIAAVCVSIVFAATRMLEAKNRTVVGLQEKDRICIDNLARIGVALRRYADEHEAKLPDSLADLYPDYVEDKKTFVCPVRGGKFEDFESDYEYGPEAFIDNPNVGEGAVAIEAPGLHPAPPGYTLILYADGHVERRPEWRE